MLLLTILNLVFADIKIYEGPDLKYIAKAVTQIKGPEERTQLTYKNMEGKITSEHSVFFKDNVLQEYKMKNLEFPIQYSVNIKDGKVFFEFTEDGKTKKGTADWTENFVVGSSLKKRLEANFNDLKEGKKVKVRIGAPSRLDTFGFEFTRVEGDEPEVKSGQWFKVKMKPSSIFIQALIKNAYYFIDSNTGKIRMYMGPNGIYRPGNEAGVYSTIKYD